jgi:hypothetical protein
MRVRRASTSCETSLMIFALSLGESVVNHFANRWEMFSGMAGQRLTVVAANAPPCPAVRAE